MQTQVKLCENSKENRIAKDVLLHRSLEERAAEYDGQLHLDGEFDWGEPIGRERW